MSFISNYDDNEDEIGEIPPGKIAWVAIRDNLDDLSINRDAISTDRLDICIKDPECWVILEKMRRLLNTASVIDGNNIKRWVFPSVPTPQEVSSNSSKSINGYLKLGFHHSPFVASTNLSHKLFAEYTFNSKYTEQINMSSLHYHQSSTISLKSMCNELSRQTLNQQEKC